MDMERVSDDDDENNEEEEDEKVEVVVEQNNKEDEDEDETIGQGEIVYTSADHVDTMVDDSPSLLPE